MPAASRYAFCYDIQRQGQSDLSPAAPLHDLRPGLSPVGASLSPSVDQGGVILDLLLLPKAGLSPSIQNVTRPDYRVCEPTAQVFPPSLQLAGPSDELLSLPGFTFLVYRVGICTD